MITVPDRIFESYDRAMTADYEPTVAEDWEPTPIRTVTDDEVEDWIAEFANTGDIEDELGYFKSHRGTVLHAVAQQWVSDKEKVGETIGPVFFRWAKACCINAGCADIENRIIG